MRAYTSTGLNTTQSNAVPAKEGAQLCRDPPTADTAPLQPHSSTAEPAQLAQVESGEQLAPAASSEPTSADMAAQSSTAEPSAEKARCFLQPNELRVIAALLMVMHRAQKDGREAMRLTKEILFTNNPITCIITELLPDDGELPSMQQLARSASEDLQKTLYLLSEQCSEAGCEPIEVFTRSAECTTHCAALHSLDSRELAARQQRLRAIEASLEISSAAESRGSELHRKLSRRVDMLSQHGVSRRRCALIAFILHETILLLEADQTEEEKDPLMAGSISSFTTCLDHMLPGVLDGLLQHENDDLTSVPALLRMLPPLVRALDSYRARAAAAKRSPAHLVKIEATVQGWPERAPHRTRLLDAMITYLSPRTAVLNTPQSDIASPTVPNSTQDMPLAAQPQRDPEQQGSQGLTEPDVDHSISNEQPAIQCQSMPVVQEAEDIPESQRNLSEAEDAQERKGKRAQERATRAQATAQVAQAEGEPSQELGLVEGIGSASEQKQPAEARNGNQPPEAVQVSKAVFPTPEGLPALSLSAALSEGTSSRGSSSLSPQPPVDFQGRLPSEPPSASEDLEARFGKMWEMAAGSRAAPAAQAWEIADDQEEEPWQQVSRPQRKRVTQQAAPEKAERRGHRQGRAKPVQAAPAQSRPRTVQAPAQPPAQAPPKTLPAPRASMRHSRAAASSRESSISPQHAVQIQEGRVCRQDAQDSPGRAARAAQAAAQKRQRSRKVKVPGAPLKPGAKLAAPKPGSRRASELRAEVAAGSRSSSLSPQPSAHPQNATSEGQQEFDFASWPALGAQAQIHEIHAAQEEQAMQDASRSLRKPLSQQAASESYVSKARKQDRDMPDQTTPAQSPSRQRNVQVPAQHAGLLIPHQPIVPPNAQPTDAVAEQLRHRLSVMTRNMPQQPSQQEIPETQLSCGPETSNSSVQYEPVQKTPGVDAVDQEFAALQQMLRLRSSSEASSHTQAGSIADLSDDGEPDEGELCVVCMEHLREIVSFPCGHMCTCQGCATDIMACPVALCPICRANIQTTVTAKF